MKSVLSFTAFFRALSMGVLVALLATGCSKHPDDCPAPESEDDQLTTKSLGAGDGRATKGDPPAGNVFRGAAPGDTDDDGDGINDDGDDEADGEGNKKGRVQH